MVVLEVLFERVAGLDVGKASVTVCLRTPGEHGRRTSVTRTFSTMTRQLAVMADWLAGAGVTVAAMESTSTYWKPVFYALEEQMDCWLLNAQHMKAVPGRKTDVKDAEWIAQLLKHGLLRPSFVPPPPIRHPRMLTRYRVQLMGDRTRDTVRLELMLEDASIKLSSVASSLTTISARAMLTAMVDGQRDPATLAEMAKGRMRTKIPQLTEALTGHFDDDHARMAAALLHRLEHVQRAIADLDEAIVEACLPWAYELALLQTIPGVGPKVAQVIVAETGADMSRFPTAAHLAAWAGVAPAIHESAGRRTPAGVRHGNKWLTAMLVEAAGSVGRMHGANYLSAQAPGSPNAAAWAGRRSLSPTRSSSRRTTCSLVTSPAANSAPTGTADATTPARPAGSSPSSNDSATPSPSTPPPDTPGNSRPGPSATPAELACPLTATHGSVGASDRPRRGPHTAGSCPARVGTSRPGAQTSVRSPDQGDGSWATVRQVVACLDGAGGRTAKVVDRVVVFTQENHTTPAAMRRPRVARCPLEQAVSRSRIASCQA